MRKKNGFTLVELLAVIVVLAIIMILAIPNVLEAMNTAKRKSFVLYAERVYKDTQIQYVSDSQTAIPGAGVYIYDIKNDLGSKDTGSYNGYVVVDANNIDDPQYIIYLWDTSYMLYNYNVNASSGFPDASNTQMIKGLDKTTVGGFDTPYKVCQDFSNNTETCMNRQGLIHTS